MEKQKIKREKTVTAIFPTAFLGPIEYYAHLKKHPNALLEVHEHFPKQTFRSRTEIYGANGKLNISIPLQRRNTEHTSISKMLISYDESWQNILWRSITAAYRSSPFFEYYEGELEKLIYAKPELLIDYNSALHQWICTKLKLENNFTPTTEYHKSYDNIIDFRTGIHPKKGATFTHAEYMQVFSSKMGFIPNLSIIDLLFNEGPHGSAIL
ncbi:MAG: WbqC family protein [Bacteroidetes bacterium]|nr:WbqC family protein [Bacteroidota bacterium]